MAKKKQTKVKEPIVEETLVVEQPKVEAPKIKAKPKNTWEIKDRIYYLKNNKKPLSYSIRASKTDDRKLKTWTTGSVGATTSALDAMQIHMLSERCLITQGANNFMLMK